jgi:integrase
MHTRIKGKAKKLTAKFCENVLSPGEYLDFGGPCPGLYFIVANDGKSKWWRLYVHVDGRRREMGLGTFPNTSLAQARIDGGVARKVAKDGINPIEKRRNEREEHRVAEAKNKNFLAVGEDLVVIKSRGAHPWWGKEKTRQMCNILYNNFKPLHALPINSAEAAEVITLRLYEILYAPIQHRTHKLRKNEPGPRWLVTPKMAKHIKKLAYGICRRAHQLKVLPITVANPAGEPLDALLTDRQPKGGHLPAMPYNQVPTLFTELVKLSQPIHDYFTTTDAIRATGKSSGFIRKLIKNEELPAIQGEPSIHNSAKLAEYEWRIQPADLYACSPMVVDVIPGIRPVIFDLIMFCALTGPRPSEAYLMRWDQYDPVERLWIMSWVETKEGEHFEQDMVIPLSDPANDIVMKMKNIQARYRMQTTEYVFANYPSRFNSNAIIGQPANNATALDNLRKALRRALPPEHITATMHGFRTNIRSWGEDQRLPNGLRRFDEKDLERALGHAAGFGKTEVARIYSRQSSDIIPSIPIFDGWAKYVTSSGQPGKVIYDDRLRRQVSTGG